MANKSDFKPSLPITRGWLNLATAVEIIAMLQLYIFSESTDKFFAWTIQVPLTAAFLGAGFGAGFILVFLYRNETLWANARVALPGVLVFTLLTLAATIIHIDKFHIVTSDDPVAVFFAWVWLFDYVVAPIVIAFASVTATLFAPVLLSETAPVKSSPELVSVIALAPALKLDVPLTEIAPLWVIAPVAVTTRFPPLCVTLLRLSAPALLI